MSSPPVVPPRTYKPRPPRRAPPPLPSSGGYSKVQFAPDTKPEEPSRPAPPIPETEDTIEAIPNPTQAKIDSPIPRRPVARVPHEQSLASPNPEGQKHTTPLRLTVPSYSPIKELFPSPIKEQDESLNLIPLRPSTGKYSPTQQSPIPKDSEPLRSTSSPPAGDGFSPVELGPSSIELETRTTPPRASPRGYSPIPLSPVAKIGNEPFFEYYGPPRVIRPPTPPPEPVQAVFPAAAPVPPPAIQRPGTQIFHGRIEIMSDEPLVPSSSDRAITTLENACRKSHQRMWACLLVCLAMLIIVVTLLAVLRT